MNLVNLITLRANFIVASDVNKPNGQHFIGPTEEEIRKFMHPLACRKISGVGRVTEKILHALGIETVHDLHERRADVFYLFKPATAQFLMRASIGYSESGLSEAPDADDTEESLHRKGISHERTFSPISSWTELCAKVETITHALIEDLKERSLRPKTVTLKVKLSNFDIISKTSSRVVALFQPGNMHQSSRDLMDITLKLLKEAKSSYLSSHNDAFSVRLLGVRCSNFQLSKDNQLSLDRFCGTMSPNRDDRTSAVVNPYKISPKKSVRPGRVENVAAASTAPDTSTDRTSRPSTSINCPICGASIRSSNDNNQINAHIDACLNTTTVKQLAKEETALAVLKEAQSKKKRSLSDFFNSNK